MGIIILQNLKKASPESKLIFHEGNHESRLHKYKWKNPELSTLRAFSVRSLLDLDKYCDEYYSYDEPYVWKETFIITHGSIVRKHSGQSAKGEIESWGLSGISGHVHRGGCYHKTDRLGDKAWYENFCMCKREKAEYINGIPNWQHGFSIIFFKTKTKRFYVQQVPIINKGFIYNGHQYGE